MGTFWESALFERAAAKYRSDGDSWIVSNMCRKLSYSGSSPSSPHCARNWETQFFDLWTALSDSQYGKFPQVQPVVLQHKQAADKNELLIWAASRGLLADAVELVGGGADPSAKDKLGARPVHFAASHGHLEILQYLSSKGVDIDSEDPKGRTPLHYAAAGGHRECMKLLIEKGGWGDAFDANDDSPLHLAARGGYKDCVSWLWRTAGVKIGLRNKRDLTPVGEALLAGHVEVAAELIEAENLNHKGSLGPCRGNLSTGQPCFDVNTRYEGEGTTPLHASALAGSAKCALLLLQNGADASIRDANGCLPSELVPVGSEADGTATACTAAQKVLSAAETKKGPKNVLLSAMTSKGPASSSSGADQGVSAQPSREWFVGLKEANQLRKVYKMSNVFEGFKAVAAISMLDTAWRGRGCVFLMTTCVTPGGDVDCFLMTRAVQPGGDVECVPRTSVLIQPGGDEDCVILRPTCLIQPLAVERGMCS
eukprot:gene16290-22477_t